MNSLFWIVLGVGVVAIIVVVWMLSKASSSAATVGGSGDGAGSSLAQKIGGLLGADESTNETLGTIGDYTTTFFGRT